MCARVFARRRSDQPFAVLFERRKELLDPACTPATVAAPTVRVGIGPTPELLAIVAHDDNAVAVERCQCAQSLDGLAHRSPGDGVAQCLAGRVYLQDAALVLGRVVAIEVLVLQPGAFEVHIVEDGPFDTCLANQAWQARLPDAFGDPHACGMRAEVVLHALSKTPDLRDFIGVGDSW